MKRIVAWTLAFIFFFITIFIPDFSSFADTVINIPTDDNTHYYLYNHIEFDSFNSNETLTNENYNLYYDNLLGADKTDFNLNFTDNNINRNALLNALINTSLLNDPSSIYFYPITYQGNIIPYEDCKHILFYNNIGFATLMYYSPTNSDIINVGNYFISDDPFIISYQAYSYSVSGDNVSVYYYTREINVNAAYDSTNNIYYNYTLESNFYGVLYSDIPCLFTSSNANYTNYNTPQKVYALYKQNDPLAIDRRTPEFINKINGGGSVSPLNYGFLDGSFDCLLYGSTFDDQGFFCAYQLNNESASIKDDLYLKLNYQFDFDGLFANNEFDYSDDYYSINGIYDLYSLNDSSYINVDMDKVFNRMNTSDRTTLSQYQNIYHKYNPSSSGWVGTPQSVNPLNSFDLLYKNGLLTSQPIGISYGDNLIESLGGSYKGFNFQLGINTNALYNETGVPQVSRLDTCLITITISIYNITTGEESGTFLYSYDYKSKTASTAGSLENGGTFGGTYNDGSQSSINNPNSSELGYNIANGSTYPVTSGSNSSATGNYVVVNDSPYPYVLVDIPENEWMNYTPNLKSLLDVYKDTLATTKDESILPLIAQTYNYIPPGAMQYLIYGVGIIVMIGIWRAITRR